MYLIESSIWKNGVIVLYYVESLQALFNVLTRVLYNFCDTSSLITSSSASGEKYVGLPVIGYLLPCAHVGKVKVLCGISCYLSHSIAKSTKVSKYRFNIKFWKTISEWDIVVLDFPKSQVKIEYLLSVSNHLPHNPSWIHPIKLQ